MTKLVLIAPPSALELLPRRENHLLLPDLTEDSDYLEYYENHRFQGRVILDNGAFEGLPWPKNTLISLGHRMGCTHIVLPDDTTGADPNPLETFLTYYDEWPKGLFRYIYVVHGRTPELLAMEAIKAMYYLKEHPEVSFDIAISSLALRFEIDGCNMSRLDRAYVRPRALMELMMMYRGHKALEGFKLPWLHLLGAVTFEEIRNCTQIIQGLTHELTFDTCDPMKEATTWTTKAPYDWLNPEETKARLIEAVERWDRI